MKASELIKILQVSNPDSPVLFTVGVDDKHRIQYAMMEILEGEVLGYLSVRGARILHDDEGLLVDVSLQQDNYDEGVIDDIEKEFYKRFQRIDQ